MAKEVTRASDLPMSSPLDELNGEFSANREVEIPDEPGPSVLGREPVVGSIRRSQGMPVLRDEVDEVDI